jgi:diacylglycerol kinase family enzyme
MAYTLAGVAGFLLVNPRAGSGRPDAAELAAAAEERGIHAHVLSSPEDAVKLAREADADALGVAGGDGSLAPIAAAALERRLPFVCIPFGTYNHFARDAGLDRGDPVGALDAFSGVECRVDVGRVNGRLFLNNVSLGAYAALVVEEQRAGRLRALLRIAARQRRTRVEIDGEPVPARIVVVGNNVYRLDPLALGIRERLDAGVLHLSLARGWLPTSWAERRAARFRIDSRARRLRAAIDGEPIVLEPPLELAVKPRALRLLLPRS